MLASHLRSGPRRDLRDDDRRRRVKRGVGGTNAERPNLGSSANDRSMLARSKTRRCSCGGGTLSDRDEATAPLPGHRGGAPPGRTGVRALQGRRTVGA